MLREQAAAHGLAGWTPEPVAEITPKATGGAKTKA